MKRFVLARRCGQASVVDKRPGRTIMRCEKSGHSYGDALRRDAIREILHSFQWTFLFPTNRLDPSFLDWCAKGGSLEAAFGGIDPTRYPFDGKTMGAGDLNAQEDNASPIWRMLATALETYRRAYGKLA